MNKHFFWWIVVEFQKLLDCWSRFENRMLLFGADLKPYFDLHYHNLLLPVYHVPGH